MALTEDLTGNILSSYNGFASFIPENFRILIPLALITITIAAYAVFVWYFYRFVARRDIIKLDLSKYNKFKYAGVIKFFAFIIYVIRFIILAPLVIFLWFSLFTVLFMILAKDLDFQAIILVCAGLISAIRITAYMSEDLSKDLAKMFPFTLLAVVILTPGFFNFQTTLERLTQIPAFFNNILYYLIFIIALEAILRLVYLIFGAADSEEKEEKE